MQQGDRVKVVHAESGLQYDASALMADSLTSKPLGRLFHQVFLVRRLW